jgi:hypothetical protein
MNAVMSCPDVFFRFRSYVRIPTAKKYLSSA